jgi:hypothetical protein
MKVTAMLCDFAQVADGKLFISGGGWSVTGPMPVPSAVALLFEVPWDRANTRIRFTLELRTTDEVPVTQLGPLGDAVPVKVEGELEVGRPAGVKAGSELNAPFAFNVPPLALDPDSRYMWVVTVAGGEPPETRLPFMTRPAQ